MSEIFLVIVMLLMAVGVCKGLQYMGRWVYHSPYGLYHQQYRSSQENILLVPMQGKMEQLEFIIRQFHHKRQWEWNSEQEIYIIDLGISEESKQILSLIQRDIAGITVCSEKEFKRLIR